MKLLTSIILACIGLTLSSQCALTMLPDPTSTSASSEFNASFGVTNLYDGNPTLADVGSTAQNGNQYAGSGAGPHVVIFDMGSTIDLTGIFYAQRLGGDPLLDKVTSINFWVESFNPGAATLGLPGSLGAADHTLTVTNTTDNNLTAYDFGSVVGSGQWVVMELPATGGNPGGSELQLATIPEPSSTILLGLASLGLLRRRR